MRGISSQGFPLKLVPRHLTDYHDIDDAILELDTEEHLQALTEEHLQEHSAPLSEERYAQLYRGVAELRVDITHVVFEGVLLHSPTDCMRCHKPISLYDKVWLHDENMDRHCTRELPMAYPVIYDHED